MLRKIFRKAPAPAPTTEAPPSMAETLSALHLALAADREQWLATLPPRPASHVGRDW